jgi:hypothetical protein
MRVLKKVVYWFVLPIVVLLIILTLFGRQWVFSYLSPPETFVLADAPTAPDYDNAYFWVALPNKIDTSDLVPVGMDTRGDEENKEVDVFFVHSTGFVGPGGWNSTMQSETPKPNQLNICCLAWPGFLMVAVIFMHRTIVKLNYSHLCLKILTLAHKLWI